jgi:hypothetical protein
VPLGECLRGRPLVRDVVVMGKIYVLLQSGQMGHGGPNCALPLLGQLGQAQELRSTLP